MPCKDYGYDEFLANQRRDHGYNKYPQNQRREHYDLLARVACAFATAVDQLNETGTYSPISKEALDWWNQHKIDDEARGLIE